MLRAPRGGHKKRLGQTAPRLLFVGWLWLPIVIVQLSESPEFVFVSDLTEETPEITFKILHKTLSFLFIASSSGASGGATKHNNAT
jgi:hypothetical protein